MYGNGRRGRTRPPPAFSFMSLLRLPADDEVRLGNERLDRVEVLPGLLVDRDRRQTRVAARVDRERSQDAVGDRQAEDLLRRRSSLATALGDRLERDVHRLRAIRGVRVRSRADLLAELLDELSPDAREGLRRLARDADIHAVAGCTVRVRVAESVRSLELCLRVAGLQVLEKLRTVAVSDASEEDHLCARGLDAGCQGLVTRGLDVPALVALDGDAELLRRVRICLGDTEAVRGLVVEHEYRLEAERL